MVFFRKHLKATKFSFYFKKNKLADVSKDGGMGNSQSLSLHTSREKLAKTVRMNEEILSLTLWESSCWSSAQRQPTTKQTNYWGRERNKFIGLHIRVKSPVFNQKITKAYKQTGKYDPFKGEKIRNDPWKRPDLLDSLKATVLRMLKELREGVENKNTMCDQNGNTNKQKTKKFIKVQ